MRAYFDEDRRSIAVDTTHPVDVFEPDCEPAHDLGRDLLTLTEKVADSYLTGDPAVTRIAWRVLLRKEPESILTCARRAGCTAAAISKRVRILSKQCGLPLNDEKLRELRRQLATRAWQKRKRREATRPPPPLMSNSKTTAPTRRKVWSDACALGITTDPNHIPIWREPSYDNSVEISPQTADINSAFPYDINSARNSQHSSLSS